MPTVSVTPLRISLTLSVPGSSKSSVCMMCLTMTIYIFDVMLVSDAPPTTGCAMPWISTAQSSGSLTDSISATQLCLRGEYRLSSLQGL